MKPSGFFTGLLFLFILIFISPLSAQTLPGETAEEPRVEEPVPAPEETAPVKPVTAEENERPAVHTGTGVIVERSRTFDLRFYDDIFPGLTRGQKRSAESNIGLRYSFTKDSVPTIIPAADSGINLLSGVMQKDPSHIIEALVIVPYNEVELELIDVYNALGRIQNIKDQTLTFRNGNVVNLFKDTTRLDNARNRRAIPDPPPKNDLPFSETMYVRFTDTYIGSLFLRGEVSVSVFGITYDLTNFRDISFAIFRIMKAERVSIVLYVEPVKEGILIYAMAGIYLPDFIISRMNLTPNINNRITILLNWIIEGLRIQEPAAAQRHKDAALLLRQENDAANQNNDPLNTIIQNEGFNRLLNN